MTKNNLTTILTLANVLCSCSGRDYKNPLDPQSGLNPQLWAPQGLTAQQSTVTAVILSWTQQEERISGFLLERQVNSAGWQQLATLADSQRSWQDMSVEPLSHLQYRLTALAGDLNSVQATAALTMEIAAPEIQSAVISSETAIQLDWIDNSLGEEGYRIQRRLNGNWANSAAVLPGNSTTWTDTSAVYGTDIAYRVHAFYQAFNSQTDSTSTVQFPVFATTDLSVALLVDPLALDLHWTNLSPVADSIEVVRDDGTASATLSVLPPNQTGFVDTTVQIGTTYGYWIHARVNGILSPPSNSAGGQIGCTDPQALNYDPQATLDNGSCFSTPVEMIFIPGGIFEMGCTPRDDEDCFEYELPRHSVTLADFELSHTEITNEQYSTYLTEALAAGDITVIAQEALGLWEGDESIFFRLGHSACRIQFTDDQFSLTGPVYANHPVTHVSWYGATAFAEFYDCRLPTEAEWEYAARSGGTEQKWSGTSNEAELNNYAWYSANNSPYGTKEVGTKLPNSLGLYDMSGNVYEWCSDWFSGTYYNESPEMDPSGPESGSGRVLRGGGFFVIAGYLRCSDRGSIIPYYAFSFLGFRIVSTN